MRGSYEICAGTTRLRWLHSSPALRAIISSGRASSPYDLEWIVPADRWWVGHLHSRALRSEFDEYTVEHAVWPNTIRVRHTILAVPVGVLGLVNLPADTDHRQLVREKIVDRCPGMESSAELEEIERLLIQQEFWRQAGTMFRGTRTR